MNPDETPRHSLIISRSTTIDWIVAPNEVEALLLEDMLIKKHKPQFNVRFRDDKRYPILKLDTSNEFPTLTVVRKFVNDGALYFGPYTSSRTMRGVMRVIAQYFPLRRCSGKLSHRERECLNFQMKKCAGACTGKISKSNYNEIVREVQLLLSGKNDELIHKLELEMADYSECLNFEAAAIKRDQLKAVKNVSGGRRLLLQTPIDIDVFSFTSTEETGYCEILLIRAGMVSGSVHLHLDLDTKTNNRLLADHFVTHYYSMGAPIPDLVISQCHPLSQKLLETFLSERCGRSAKIKVPHKGIYASLLRLARSNLMIHKQMDVSTRTRKQGPVAVQKLLELEKAPTRIEAIDISENQGKFVVGSVISFKNGKPEKDRYKRYRIRSESATSDIERIHEVVYRRLKRRNKHQWDLPDLLLIDGGKLQLASALAAAKSLNLHSINIISLAKARNNRSKEGIFLATGEEIVPDPDDPALRYLDSIRDEAHRFAITYHRELRAKSLLKSSLMEIPGIGKQRRKDLLESFGSIKTLREANLPEIVKTPGIGMATAKTIKNYLNAEKTPESKLK